MSVFDFLGTNPKYSDSDVRRMNLRHRFVIEPYVERIKGARVLDLASHDGRWPYAFAKAGAKQVVGIEGRAELVAQFATYPDKTLRRRVQLHVGDIFEGLRALAAKGEKFDVVGVLGIYYHIMDHYGLLCLIHRLSPRLIIVDSEFMTAPWPHIALVFEDTSKDLNSTAYVAGQTKVPVGIPSCAALERMASSLGYATEWQDWGRLPAGERGAVGDYFRSGPKRRFTCALVQAG